MKSPPQKERNEFRHESLQDPESIRDLLAALTRGLARGKLTFSDENGKISMQPEGLLDLKLTASKDDGRHRVTVRITWQVEDGSRKARRSLRVT